MGIITDLMEFKGETQVPTCDICGERPAAAYWAGQKEFCVCRKCALEVLPRLAADAVVGDTVYPNTCSHVSAAKLQMEAAFMRGAVLSVVRTHQKEKPASRRARAKYCKANS